MDKNSLREIKRYNDYIILGTVVDQINLDDNRPLNLMWEINKVSLDVVIKVDKVISGALNTEYICVTQFNAGNCNTGFIKGKQYVIAGKKVDGFINHTPLVKEKTPDNSEDNEEIKTIDPTELRKTEFSEIKFENNRFIIDHLEKDFTHWNQLCKEKVVIATNSCRSGSVNSDFGKLLLGS